MPEVGKGHLLRSVMLSTARLAKTACVIGLASCLPTLAIAQFRFEVTPTLGTFVAGNEIYGVQTSVPIGLRSGSYEVGGYWHFASKQRMGPTVGATATWWILSRWAFELRATYARTSVDTASGCTVMCQINQSLPAGDTVSLYRLGCGGIFTPCLINGGASVLLWSAATLLAFPIVQTPWAVHISVGLGRVARLGSAWNGIDVTDRTTVIPGGGVRYRVHRRLAFRTDLEDHISRTPPLELPRTLAAVQAPRWQHDVTVTAGLSVTILGSP